MKVTLRELCKRCKGKCCRPPIYLGQVDVDRLIAAGKKFKIERTDEAGFDLISSDKCPFLKEDVGCTLESDLKSIDCILFPLAFTESNDGFKFYLNKLCPFFKEIPRDWIKETKKWARVRLKDWSKSERRTYAERQKDRLSEIL